MSQVYSELSQCLNKEYCISKNYFWTDSAVVHCWMKNRQKEYKPYVPRRLRRIRDVITEYANWMLVPSKLNPADLPTRGVTPHNLAKSKMWFHGPDFLGSEFVNLQHNLISTKPLPTLHCFRIFIWNIVFVYKVIEIVQYFTFSDI